ncbi:hypothetical protein T265_11187 [Opisthorchis viverrini]|uniref:Uncharacterized protein n=1 Tax=Opisthorchis viverrini TaxID=6198 RepID=A0A074Z3Z2_OPIVI|nr:hypothetical protein T265_11187 [Opisthorchis viverrini]KER20217.1 hypothetical protein T265_11187 [Opisthorchis viverrini]
MAYLRRAKEDVPRRVVFALVLESPMQGKANYRYNVKGNGQAEFRRVGNASSYANENSLRPVAAKLCLRSLWRAPEKFDLFRFHEAS